MYTRVCLLYLIWIGIILEAAAVVQDFYWRNYVHGDIPYDAVEAAPGLYIGQVNFKEYLLPTAIYPYRKIAITTDVKREYVKDNIKILCTLEPKRFYWDKVDFTTKDFSLMTDAVVGGFRGAYVMYIGLLKHKNNWKIGRVYDASEDLGILVWDDDGKVPTFHRFELLKYNSTSLDRSDYRLCDE